MIMEKEKLRIELQMLKEMDKSKDKRKWKLSPEFDNYPDDDIIQVHFKDGTRKEMTFGESKNSLGIRSMTLNFDVLIKHFKEKKGNENGERQNES